MKDDRREAGAVRTSHQMVGISIGLVQRQGMAEQYPAQWKFQRRRHQFMEEGKSVTIAGQSRYRGRVSGIRR